mgnify:CR=1 FL=1
MDAISGFFNSPWPVMLALMWLFALYTHKPQEIASRIRARFPREPTPLEKVEEVVRHWKPRITRVEAVANDLLQRVAVIEAVTPRVEQVEAAIAQYRSDYSVSTGQREQKERELTEGAKTLDGRVTSIERRLLGSDAAAEIQGMPR